MSYWHGIVSNFDLTTDIIDLIQIQLRRTINTDSSVIALHSIAISRHSTVRRMHPRISSHDSDFQDSNTDLIVDRL